MSQLEHLVGRVKWFNNKTGYGFITITDGSRSGSDIFVHHSAILVDSQQYKYLVQGEYVEFDLVRTESTTHEWQASSVVGIKGGKLMCETRNEARTARNEYRSTRPHNTNANATNTNNTTTNTTNNSNSEKKPRQRKSKDADNKEWSLVDNKRNKRSNKNARS